MPGPYKPKKIGGKYKVVDKRGVVVNTSGTFDTRDEAYRQAGAMNWRSRKGLRTR